MTEGGIVLESKKQRARQERRTLKKAQEVNYQSEFKAADRALRNARGDQ